MTRRRKPQSQFPKTPIKQELEISSVQEFESKETNAPDLTDVPQLIPQYQRGTSDLTIEEEDEYEYSNPVIMQFPKRKSIYYSVTEAEINIYAQLGWISTLFLAIFGVLIGLAFGCYVALIQEDIPSEAQSLLKSTGWITGIISIIFFASALYFIFLQKQNKKAWESSE